MAPDHDPDDERLGPDDPLPPEDRLWRHPSELAAGVEPPAAWFEGHPRDPAPVGRRSLAVGAMAGACLAGAVMAVGAMWIARPTRVVHHDAAVTTATPISTARYTFTPVPTETLASELGPSLPSIRAHLADGTWATGSGVWLDRAGTVLTATPLVAGATEVIVIGIDGIGQLAKVAGADEGTGITALRVRRTSGTPMDLTVASPRPGEPVAIVGAPGTEAGEDASAASSASTAVAVVRVASMRSSVDDLVLHQAVQLDRTVPADAVGGLLVDARGRVVGISLGSTSTRGLGVVTPAAEAIKAATSLRDHGSVERAWLGVRATDLDPNQAGMLQVPGAASLTQVTPASPAAAAGLRPGDIITSVGSTRIDDASDLVNVLGQRRPGDRVAITWRRGTATLTRTVTLGG